MSNTQNDQKKQDYDILLGFIKVSKLLKYRLIVISLVIVIILILSGTAYIVYRGYSIINNQKEKIQSLENEVNKLQSEKNVSIDDLKKTINEQTQEIKNLIAEKENLSNQLEKAKAKIDELTPKDIRDLEYKKVINPNSSEISWLNPVYVDVNGDNRLDGIFAYKTGAPGHFLNVYVYAYLNGNNLVQILKAENYLKGNFNYITEESVLEITSEAGTPDSPQQAKSRFKWDPAQNKMVLLQRQ